MRQQPERKRQSENSEHVDRCVVLRSEDEGNEPPGRECEDQPRDGPDTDERGGGDPRQLSRPGRVVCEQPVDARIDRL